MRRRHCVAAKAKDSYLLGISPQSISKSMLGLLYIEGCIFMSKQNSILSIFIFWCRKFKLLTEDEFLSDPTIGFISSSKSNFSDLGQYFWLGITPGNSNPSLTLSWKNPKILKLMSFGRFAISRYWRRLRN